MNTKEEINFRDIVNKFKDNKFTDENVAMAKCPCHDDNKSSLSLKYDSSTNKVLIYCHAGCNTKDILNSVGLTFENLGSSEQLDKNPNFQDIYKYYDESNNKFLYERIRFKDKKFSPKRYINGHVVWGLRGGEYTETYPGSNEYSQTNKLDGTRKFFPPQKPILYNLFNLIKSIKKGYPVYIVEGEKDVITMGSLGLVATTAPSGAGKGKWLDSYSKYFRGASVIIMPDNDNTGQLFAKEIQYKIKNYAHATKIITVSDKPKGDVTDWIDAGHTSEELKKIVSNTDWTYAPWIYDNNKINTGILAECIQETLDYYLVSDVCSSNILIYLYEKGVYNEISINTFKNRIKSYIPTALRKPSIINDCANLMLYEETKKSSLLIGDKSIINLENGLYNPLTNEFRLHNNQYITSVQLNLKYNYEPINYGYWDNFINYLFDGDDELKKILQEAMGLTFSNYDGTKPKALLVLYGPGDTGKSKVIDVIIDILKKDNTKSIPLQDLGERFKLGQIHNKRLIQYAELPTKPISDTSVQVLKGLTGEDTISIERKGIDDFDIKYRGFMIYTTNTLPPIVGDTGNHVFNRFVILPCTKKSIPKEKQDGQLIDKLLLEKEYIFKWSMDGLKRLVSNKFKFSYSKASDNAKLEYMCKSDSVREFINVNYSITNDIKDRIKVTEIYLHYKDWCTNNGRLSVSRSKFKEKIINGLCIPHNPKHNGYECFECISLKCLESTQSTQPLEPTEKPMTWANMY